MPSFHRAHCSHLVTCARAPLPASSGCSSAVGRLALWSVNWRGASACCNYGEQEKLNIPSSCTPFFNFHVLLIYFLLWVIIFLSFLFFGRYFIFHCFIPQLIHLSVSLDNSSPVADTAEHLVLLYGVSRRAVSQHTGSRLFIPKVWEWPRGFQQDSSDGSSRLYLSCSYHATSCGLCTCNSFLNKCKV